MRAELVHERVLGRGRGDAERPLRALAREQEGCAARRLGRDLRLAQPAQLVLLVPRLVRQVGAEHEQQRQRQHRCDRRLAEREHDADRGERDHVGAREAVAATGHDPHQQAERSHAERARPACAPLAARCAASTAAHSSPSTMPRTGSWPATVRTSGSGSMSQPMRPHAHARARAIRPASRRAGAPASRAAPQAEQRERGHRGAEVERLDLGTRDAHAARQGAPVAAHERADAVGIDVARGRRLAQQLEPRHERDGREREGPGEREAAALQPARARARDQPDRRGQERQRRELLRAAREMHGEHHREPRDRETAPRRARARDRLGERERRRQPGRAAQQPERRRARDQVARGGEGDRAERRACAPRAELARERVGAEPGDQVVEGGHGAQRVDRVEHPGREQHRGIGHPGLCVGQERLPRERPGRPERDVARCQPLVQEARDRRVEGREIGRRRELAAQRERREHQCDRADHGGDGGPLAPHRGSHRGVTRRRREWGRHARSRPGRAARPDSRRGSCRVRRRRRSARGAR